MNFRVGQKVVCVDSSKGRKNREYPPLVEGKSYKILAIQQCTCGSVTVDVGLTSNVLGDSYCFCCDRRTNRDYKFWPKQTRFVPIDWDEQADEAIRESLNESLKINS